MEDVKEIIKLIRKYPNRKAYLRDREIYIDKDNILRVTLDDENIILGVDDLPSTDDLLSDDFRIESGREYVDRLNDMLTKEKEKAKMSGDLIRSILEEIRITNELRK